MKYIKLFEYSSPGIKFEVVEKYPIKIAGFFVDSSWEDFISFLDKNYPNNYFRSIFASRNIFDSYNRGKIFILLDKSTLWSQDGVIDPKPKERLMGITMNYSGKILTSGWEDGKMPTEDEMSEASSVIFNNRNDSSRIFSSGDTKIKEDIEKIRVRDSVEFSRIINTFDNAEILPDIAKYFKEKYPIIFRSGSILSRFK